MSRFLVFTLFTALAVLSFSQSARAQELTIGELIPNDLPTTVCLECRDPIDHPEDWRNQAFNIIAGPNSWMSFDDADMFNMMDLNGNVVIIDASFVVRDSGVSVSYSILGLSVSSSIPLATEYLEFKIQLPNGDLITQRININSGSLPVGDGSQPPPSLPSGDGPGEGIGDSGDDSPFVEPGMDSQGLTFPPGATIVINGGSGNYCGPGTGYICIYM